MQGVELYNTPEGTKWNAVASHVGTRTEKQCRERWMNVINEQINKGVSACGQIVILYMGAEGVMHAVLCS